MNACNYFMKTELNVHGQFHAAMGPARCRVGEGLLPERSVDVKETRGMKLTHANLVDHDLRIPRHTVNHRGLVSTMVSVKWYKNFEQGTCAAEQRRLM